MTYGENWGNVAALEAENARLQTALAEAQAVADFCRGRWTAGLTSRMFGDNPTWTHDAACAAAEGHVAGAVESFKQRSTIDG